MRYHKRIKNRQFPYASIGLPVLFAIAALLGSMFSDDWNYGQAGVTILAMGAVYLCERWF